MTEQQRPEMGSIEFSKVIEWLKQDSSGWALIVLVMFYVLPELERRESNQAVNWQAAQKRHEDQTEKQTNEYQDSIDRLVIQWKEDRQMMIDLLKDGKLDSKPPLNGGSMIMPPSHGKELLDSTVSTWKQAKEQSLK